MGHIERLLVAENDYATAKDFRAVAEQVVKLRTTAVELYTAVDQSVPDEARTALEAAQLEYKQLNRICLRHAARQLDVSLRAEGQDSEMESAVIMFDISNPVGAAA